MQTNYKINNQIKATQLRVVDETGENLGVLPLEKALEIAKSKELDLIEIAPTANPPVAKIISFDKFRYQKEKELKKQKASQKTSELKQVQISLAAAKNDLETKIKKMEEFLNDGDKVNIVLVLKGREKYNRNWAYQKLNEFLKMIPIEYKIINEPKFMGRGLMMQIMKR
ncbi:translation initiation factor IF-3 [Candidatus Wolfebacteria bacterium]|nr:translation initiation factor IF-3 [Candidatus Wolfebacteria bacterium]